MNRKLLDDFHHLPPQTHISAFYDDDEQRLEILSAYYNTGLENKELCIFVTRQKSEGVIGGFKRHGLDISDAVELGDFHIFPTDETYLPDGEFKSSRMLANLRNFVDKGMSEGYTGVRGGGDMDWMDGYADRTDEVVKYEAKINRFVRTHNFTGICLMPIALLNSRHIQAMIQNHQFIIKNSILVPNPFYVPQERSFKLDLELVAQMETWLDWLDDHESMNHKAVSV